MLSARRFVPVVCGLRTRAIHQSVQARNGTTSTNVVAVEKKEDSVTESISSITGKTGPIIAAGALATVAYANELLLLHSESVVAVSFAACVYGLYHKGGDILNEMIKEQRDEAVARFDMSKNEALAEMTEELAHLKSQLNLEETLAMRYNATKEIAVAQEELFYRRRNNTVVEEYKKFLDTAAATAMSERKAEQMRMVDAMENNFLASFNAASDKLVVDKCIADLQTVKF